MFNIEGNKDYFKLFIDSETSSSKKKEFNQFISKEIVRKISPIVLLQCVLAPQSNVKITLSEKSFEDWSQSKGLSGKAKEVAHQAYLRFEAVIKKQCIKEAHQKFDSPQKFLKFVQGNIELLNRMAWDHKFGEALKNRISQIVKDEQDGINKESPLALLQRKLSRIDGKTILEKIEHDQGPLTDKELIAFIQRTEPLELFEELRIHRTFLERGDIDMSFDSGRVNYTIHNKEGFIKMIGMMWRAIESNPLNPKNSSNMDFLTDYIFNVCRNQPELRKAVLEEVGVTATKEFVDLFIDRIKHLYYRKNHVYGKEEDLFNANFEYDAAETFRAIDKKRYLKEVLEKSVVHPSEREAKAALFLLVESLEKGDAQGMLMASDVLKNYEYLENLFSRSPFVGDALEKGEVILKPDGSFDVKIPEEHLIGGTRSLLNYARSWLTPEEFDVFKNSYQPAVPFEKIDTSANDIEFLLDQINSRSSRKSIDFVLNLLKSKTLAYDEGLEAPCSLEEEEAKAFRKIDKKRYLSESQLESWTERDIHAAQFLLVESVKSEDIKGLSFARAVLKTYEAREDEASEKIFTYAKQHFDQEELKLFESAFRGEEPVVKEESGPSEKILEKAPPEPEPELEKEPPSYEELEARFHLLGSSLQDEDQWMLQMEERLRLLEEKEKHPKRFENPSES